MLLFFLLLLAFVIAAGVLFIVAHLPLLRQLPCSNDDFGFH